jgi:hypothetical protein
VYDTTLLLSEYDPLTVPEITLNVNGKPSGSDPDKVKSTGTFISVETLKDEATGI